MDKSYILKSHNTEKTSSLSNNNVFVFFVRKSVNKIELQKFIQSEYKVDVLNINICNTSQKPKKRGRIKGYTKSFKKAYVKVKEGQKIEFSAPNQKDSK